MKIIISEDQQKVLLESKQIESAQNLVDMVVDVSKTTSIGYLEKKELSQMHITIDIHLESIYLFYDLDNFIYQLQGEVRNILGGSVASISIGEVINKRKESN